MAGQRINDYGGMPHDSDMAMKSKTHLKEHRSVEGAGGIKDYEDTDSRIRETQSRAEKHIKGRNLKPGNRY